MQEHNAGTNSNRHVVVHPCVMTAAYETCVPRQDSLGDKHVALSLFVAADVSAVVFALGSTIASAQSGKLHLRVTPKQTYVYVDDSSARLGPALSENR